MNKSQEQALKDIREELDKKIENSGIGTITKNLILELASKDNEDDSPCDEEAYRKNLSENAEVFNKKIIEALTLLNVPK